MQKEQFKLSDILNEIKKGVYKQPVQDIQEKKNLKTQNQRLIYL